MKNLYASAVFILSDFLMILCSVYLSHVLYFSFFATPTDTFNDSLFNFVTLYPLYLITLAVFTHEGIYTYRFDFWHESKMIIKSLVLSLVILFAYLAMTHSIEEYSRGVIVLTFGIISFVIPLSKNILKKNLYKIGLWRRKATVYSNDPFVTKEIFDNHYMGYVESSEEKAQTVFINSAKKDPQMLQAIIDQKIQKTDEVIFVPFIDAYDLTQSTIYQLSNTRTNLIVFTNRLKCKTREKIHVAFNYFLALIIVPLLLPVVGMIAILIKKESEGSVFFAHKRVGKYGKEIPTLKFRSMYKDAGERLEKLLETEPQIREEWEKNFKLKNDPRVTKVGAFLRKTSLDELPQIFNVLKGEMNFVGPRPVIQKEIDNYYKEDAQYYFMVKPGITGLWQVSGRSDTDYEFRVATDRWYVSNWSLWLDIIILVKTIKVVLKRDGAY